MRALTVAASVALAALSAGCSDDPTSPKPAIVQFDSLAIVNSGGFNWLALYVHNVGQSTAYDVTVYWHFTGSDSAQQSQTRPPNLAGGQSGYALALRTDNVAWTWPTTTDSIHWSETP